MSAVIYRIINGISIHALRGEGDYFTPRPRPREICISIHALRGEGDVLADDVSFCGKKISIHALRGEGDVKI